MENTLENRKLISVLLNNNKAIKAKFSLGLFTSELAASLVEVDYKGEITSIDEESGYCNWNNEKGQEMPCVNINCITLNNF